MSSLYSWTCFEPQQSRLGLRGRSFSLSQWTDSLDSKKQMDTQLENLLFETGKRRECLGTALLYPEMPVAELRDDLQ
jgi:hypothetical protein